LRLSKVSLRGYARFSKASCNVDGRVIAFVGPNEAGKTSLLRALQWLTDPGAAPLPSHVRNREAPPDPEDPVVNATFILNEDEVEKVRALDVDTAQDRSTIESYTFEIGRRSGGQLVYWIKPRLDRDPEPFEAAETAFENAKNVFQEGESEYAEDFLEEWETFEAYLSVDDDLDENSQTILEGGATNLRALLDRMAAAHPEGEGEPDQVALAGALRELDRVVVAAAKPDPQEAAMRVLWPAVPRFIMFDEADRHLPATFDVNAEVELPNALRNLLTVAGTSIEEIRRALNEGISGYRTLEGKINSALSSVSAYWSQSELRPHIGIAPNGLIDITIDDAEGYTAITERSEGLRAFLALTCFLLTSGDDVPPILLIDEAERNLHYDAQGDLVRLLTNELPVDQVIYTTHSPGCLPLDLGNGIRIVARVTSDSRQSELRSNFWADNEPGFSRLLFAMGAEAAAFSALNKALLTEGPTEMILLPSLLRAADTKRRFDFQVAFGLSGMSVPNDLGTVALLTTYLVDGDSAGTKKLAALKKAGVPDTNLLQLPAGQAIEDLLDRDFYLDAVDGVIRDSGGTVLVDRAALDSTQTVAKAVDLLEKSIQGFKAPGHKVVASRISRNPELLRISKGGLAYLRDDLWPKLELAFANRYTLGSA
jgi:predicted ATP-dependent endonuclease of OLD family